MTRHNLVFRLPQTVIRSLGTPDLRDVKFFQHVIHKSFQSHDKSLRIIYEINELLLKINNCHLANRVVKHKDMAKFFTPDLILDKNLTTDLDQSTIDLSRIPITIIEYATSDHLVTFTDIFKHPLLCSKATIKSIKQLSHLKIKKYLCWVGNINLIQSNLFNFNWKNELLDQQLCANRIFESRFRYAELDSSLYNYLTARNPILVIPSFSKLDDRLASSLSSYLSSFTGAVNHLDQLTVDGIFIKLHRGAPIDRNMVKGFPRQIGGYPVHIMTRDVERHTPAEWFLFANKPSLVIADIGSAIFSAPHDSTLLLSNESEFLAKKTYPLSLKRFT